MRAAKWESLVDRHFAFLRAEYACRIVDRSGGGWTTDVVYQNSTTAVVVSFDAEFDRVEVRLIRLVDGERPRLPIFVSEEPILHNVWMLTLLAVTAADKFRIMEALRGLSPEQVEQQLLMWADIVRTYAADVLRGDFAVFEPVERYVRDKVREHPETIRISVPAGTDAMRHATVQKVRREFPHIPIEVGSYRVPRRVSAVERFRHWLRRRS